MARPHGLSALVDEREHRHDEQNPPTTIMIPLSSGIPRIQATMAITPPKPPATAAWIAPAGQNVALA